jgi:hypothetical protein
MIRRRIIFLVFIGVFGWVAISLAATWTITWVDNSTDETGFRVERRVVPSGSYSQIGTTAAGVTTYVDSTANDGWAYRYRVRAYNASGNSRYSNEGCAPPPCVPTVPTGVMKAP